MATLGMEELEKDIPFTYIEKVAAKLIVRWHIKPSQNPPGFNVTS
jgi:hypothetical protein